MAKKTEEQGIADECIKRAQKRFGPGWALLSVEIRWAFVSEEILQSLFLQSTRVDAAYKLEFFRKVRSEAALILDPGKDDA